MWKMETFILAEANAQAKEIERLKERLANKQHDNVSVTGLLDEIERLQAELERYKKCFADAEVEINRIKTAIQQCLNPTTPHWQRTPCRRG